MKKSHVSRDYLPCSGYKLELERSLSMDLLRLNDKGIAIIKDLRDNCENIVNYKFEFTSIPENHKIPKGFEKHNCFQVRVEDFSFFIYKDILSKDNICVMFDIVHHV